MRRAMPLKHVVGAAALVMVMVLIVAYIYSSVLGGSIAARPVHVTVSLSETGGLYEGSGVTYRGVRVGSVDAIELEGDHVTAKVALAPGSEVPADTKAVVRTLSPAGEQFLDLQPARDGAPFLADGDEIAGRDTSTPTSVAETLAALDRLMAQVDVKDLRTVTDELSAAFADPDDLGRVIDSGTALLTTLDSVWPETLRTLQQGRTVLRTGIDTADQFRSFAASARSLTAWLQSYDPRLRKHLAATPAQLTELQTFADAMVKALPPLLKDFSAFTGVFAAYDPHVREMLIQFPKGLDSLVGAFAGGRMQTNMLVALGSVCSYGVPDSNPQLTVRAPLDPDRFCPASFEGQQRGSAHVPGPVR